MSAEPAMDTEASLAPLDISLERDLFMRRLLRELAGALQDVVGLEEASGYISLVGGAMADGIDAEYRRALRVDRLSRAQVGAVLVDLKRRIQGAFEIVEETEDRIVFVNSACPFGAMVEGRPSLCMMTATVFGRIAAQHLGYAAVGIDRAIARGDPGCRVVLYLRPGGDGTDRHEFYRRDDAPLA